MGTEGEDGEDRRGTLPARAGGVGGGARPAAALLSPPCAPVPTMLHLQDREKQ